MSDNKEYYHNKGEEDASNGKYNPPHGIGDSLTTWSSSEMQRHIEENEAYNKGYSHTKGQIDGSKNDYNSSYSGDDSYNSGWESGYDNRDSGSSSSCFITTATLTSMGKPDNCTELNVFRNFRDRWLIKQSDGQELIAEYRKIAPRIVTGINSVPDSKNIYKQLWIESIRPCLTLIKQNRFIEAKTIYCNVVADLKQKFLDK